MDLIWMMNCPYRSCRRTVRAMVRVKVVTMLRVRAVTMLRAKVQALDTLQECARAKAMCGSLRRRS